jgi:hypothetical protein
MMNIITTATTNRCHFLLKNISTRTILGRQFSQDGTPRKIIARYTDKIPITLFRIYAGGKKVKLRDYDIQVAKGSASYDLRLKDGLVHPAPLDDIFIGPNGATLRPAGINMWDILSSRKGVTNILEIPAGTPIPKDLVLLHEHGDHYSLQCVKPIRLKHLEDLMNGYFYDLPILSKKEFFVKYPLPSRW